VMPVTESKDGADLADVPKAATTGWRWRAAVIALAAMLLTAVILLRLRSEGESPQVMTVVPFTSYPGRETAPSVSPDGSRIVFSWDQSTTGSGTVYDLYMKSIGSETLSRLTDHPASWISSAWSPDGTQIAFMRIDGADTGRNGSSWPLTLPMVWPRR
jgi:Tol biopolymer transport system component